MMHDVTPVTVLLLLTLLQLVKGQPDPPQSQEKKPDDAPLSSSKGITEVKVGQRDMRTERFLHQIFNGIRPFLTNPIDEWRELTPMQGVASKKTPFLDFTMSGDNMLVTHVDNVTLTEARAVRRPGRNFTPDVYIRVEGIPHILGGYELKGLALKGSFLLPINGAGNFSLSASVAVSISSIHQEAGARKIDVAIDAAKYSGRFDNLRCAGLVVLPDAAMSAGLKSHEEAVASCDNMVIAAIGQTILHAQVERYISQVKEDVSEFLEQFDYQLISNQTDMIPQ